MAEKRKVICTGTQIDKSGKELPCNRIIAEIDFVNDARLQIKCSKCGTMNVIEAKPKQKPLDTETKEILHSLGRFPITHIST